MTAHESADLQTGVAKVNDVVAQELSAIQTVLGALSPLDGDSRGRVLDYVFRVLKIQQVAPAQPAPVAAQPAASPIVQPVGATPSQLVRDIRSLKEQKQPRTAIDMAVLVAYYLAELAPDGARKAEIGTDDVTAYFKQAGYPLPSQPRQTLFNAKAAGYLDASSHGAYKLNPVGHNLVAHNLPSSSVENTKPRRARKASAKKAAARKRK